MSTKTKTKAQLLAAELLGQASGIKVVAVPALRPEPPTEPAAPSTVRVCDPGPPPINTLFGVGRPNVPPPSRKDGKRRSGDYLLGAQRIKAEVAARPGDYLNGSDIDFAEGWMDTALQPVPAEMAQVGSGGELIPLGKEGGALVLRNTVEHPHYVTADASRDEKVSLYDISDGATWANKAELGIIVSRQSPQDRLTEIGIRKVKFWETGRLGDLHLAFDDRLRAFV